jgi:hypothetical protein
MPFAIGDVFNLVENVIHVVRLATGDLLASRDGSKNVLTLASEIQLQGSDYDLRSRPVGSFCDLLDLAQNSKG